ncbi:MAG TPA: hypothetical protein VM076_11435 [Gemmatimonadaceae bacterium]|nr:hypothetical protein [Gemmatimonadaceae bacterium]
MPSRSAIALALAVVSTAARAQDVQQLQLTRPIARSANGYTDIVGVRELPDGRIVAVDLRERRIVLLDLARGTARDAAREGQGPREFTGAFTVVPWLGDSLLVYGRRDFLKISPSGEPVVRFAVNEAMTRTRGGLGAPRFADKDGNIYFERSQPLEQAPNGNFIPTIDGSLWRWNVRTNAVDSVGAFRHRDPKQVLTTYYRPYPARDGTAVLSDGRVAIVHATDYRVEILRDGRRVVEGPRVAYTPLPVGPDERNAFRDDAIRRPRGSISLSGGNAKPQSGAEREAARREINIPDDAFPPRMSPIVEDRSTFVDPANRIWVARTSAASSTDRQVDVFNDRAELVARVTLRNRGRVVGFGKASVYIVTPDEDDVEWIERYAMPAIR